MTHSPDLLSRRLFALGGACALLSSAARSGAAAGPTPAAAPAKPAAKLIVKASDALLVIDVQNCFLPGGSLAVKDGATQARAESYNARAPRTSSTLCALIERSDRESCNRDDGDPHNEGSARSRPSHQLETICACSRDASTCVFTTLVYPPR